MTSWIVSFVQKTKDDPQSHTNQHEPKHSCLELDRTFEAKLSGCQESDQLWRPHQVRFSWPSGIPPSESMMGCLAASLLIPVRSAISFLASLVQMTLDISSGRVACLGNVLLRQNRIALRGRSVTDLNNCPKVTLARLFPRV